MKKKVTKKTEFPKFKLSFGTPKFISFVRGGESVIKCVYECTLHKSGKVFYEFTVEAEAVCSIHDCPSDRVGRNLAESRAKRKAYAAARDYYGQGEIEAFYKVRAEMSARIALVEQMSYLAKKEMHHVNYLLHE